MPSGFTSMPANFSPAACAARSCVTISTGCSPAFSAKV